MHLASAAASLLTQHDDTALHSPDVPPADSQAGVIGRRATNSGCSGCSAPSLLSLPRPSTAEAPFPMLMLLLGGRGLCEAGLRCGGC